MWSYDAMQAQHLHEANKDEKHDQLHTIDYLTPANIIGLTSHVDTPHNKFHSLSVKQ